MAGVSRLIEARYKCLPPPRDDETQKRNRKRDKKKNDRDMDTDAKEEWEETQEWEKEIADDPSLLDNIP